MSDDESDDERIPRVTADTLVASLEERLSKDTIEVVETLLYSFVEDIYSGVRLTESSVIRGCDSQLVSLERYETVKWLLQGCRPAVKMMLYACQRLPATYVG